MSISEKKLRSLVESAGRASRLNRRQREFAKNVAIEGMNATQAYAKAYDKSPNIAAGVSGHRLLKNVNVQAIVEAVHQQMQIDAPEAYKELKKMAADPHTPAQVREKILDKILTRAGLDPERGPSVDARQVNIYQGLTDSDSKKEILEKALQKYQPHAGEI